jgi:hypothetical protein
MASPASTLRSRTPARLYLYDTILEWLSQDLQDMAAALGKFIQEEYAMVGQRDLARHRHVPLTDQSRSRDGLVGGAKRASRHQRGAGAGEAGDAVDARRLNGLGEGHRREDGGEPACQHPGENPPRWGWAPVYRSSESNHRGSAIFCTLYQHIWGFVIVDPAGLILLAYGPALPRTADGVWPISTEASGECAFASSPEVDFTGGDITLA